MVKSTLTSCWYMYAVYYNIHNLNCYNLYHWSAQELCHTLAGNPCYLLTITDFDGETSPTVRPLPPTQLGGVVLNAILLCSHYISQHLRTFSHAARVWWYHPGSTQGSPTVAGWWRVWYNASLLTPPTQGSVNHSISQYLIVHRILALFMGILSPLLPFPLPSTSRTESPQSLCVQACTNDESRWCHCGQLPHFPRRSWPQPCLQETSWGQLSIYCTSVIHCTCSCYTVSWSHC